MGPAAPPIGGPLGCAVVRSSPADRSPTLDPWRGTIHHKLRGYAESDATRRLSRAGSARRYISFQAPDFTWHTSTFIVRGGVPVFL